MIWESTSSTEPKATRDAATVRIAMTVAELGMKTGVLLKSLAERGIDGDEPVVTVSMMPGRINADLTVGANLTGSAALKANRGLASMGPALGSRGFVVEPNEVAYLSPILNPFERASLVPLRNGDDLLYGARGVSVPLLSSIETEQEFRERAPHLYQRLRERVYPKRKLDRDPKLRKYWWRFRRTNEDYFALKNGLYRYIATVETAKHRIFFFVDSEILIEHGTVAIGFEDAFELSILSSRLHVVWSLAAGGTLEDRPRYNKIRTFDPFPFPDCADALKATLRAAGDELDATRKLVLAEHPDLTLTGLYNRLEKVKAGVALTPIEEDAKQRGRVLILKELHEQIDTLTAQAYGWPADLSDEAILERLVALNAERAREEAAGHVRWLRPDYQIPRFAKGAQAKTGELDLGETVVAIDKGLPAFPVDRYEQPLAVEAMLAAAGTPMGVTEISRGFKRGGKRIEQRVVQVLTTLVRYGRVVAMEDGRYAARRAA